MRAGIPKSIYNRTTIFLKKPIPLKKESQKYFKKIYLSSVMEFQRWWVLRSKLFGQESTCHQKKIFKKFLRVMTVCQKLGVILESKLVQKTSIEYVISMHASNVNIF